MGWLASPEQYATENTFTIWVDRWLLPASPLPCTSLELYAARCGVLHTFTANSRLADKGAVRRVVYAWGGASVTDLQARADSSEPGRNVAVDIDALYNGLHDGVANFLHDALKDSHLGTVLQTKARQYFHLVRPSDYL